MAVFLLPTKLYVAPIPGYSLARPRLMECLDDILQSRLAVVSAPAGFGKTTLLSTWVQRSKTGAGLAGRRTDSRLPVRLGWLSLDEDDDDPQRFLEYLIATLEENGVLLDTSGPFLLSDALPGPRAAAAAILPALTCLEGDFVLILDDYHFIRNEWIHALLNEFLDHAPQSFHLVLSTRSDPPLKLGRLRAAGQLLELRTDDLRFTAQEIKTFLTDVQGFTLSDEQVERLADCTEGWIAGLQMAALSMHQKGDIGGFVSSFTGSHRYIFDYMFEQVLSQQTDEVKKFLLYTSVVDRLNASLCDALLAGEQVRPSRMILHQLEQTNAFLAALDDARYWFRYHHLFGELLTTLLEQTFPAVVPELHRRASRWYEQHRLIPDAIDHALAAGESEQVARLILGNVLSLVEHVDIKTILARIAAFFARAGAGEISPWLRVAHAWVLAFAGDFQRAELQALEIEKILGAITEPAMKARLGGHLKAIQANTACSLGQARQAIILAEQASEMLPADEMTVRALTSSTLGGALSDVGEYERAIEACEQAVALGMAAESLPVFMLASSGLAYACSLGGKYSRALTVCETAEAQAEEYCRRYSRLPPAVASIYSQIATAYQWRDEIDKTIYYGKRGMLISESWGHLDSMIANSSPVIVGLIATGDLDEAERVVAAVERAIRGTSPLYEKLLAFLRGHIILARGDWAEARKIAAELGYLDQDPFKPELVGYCGYFLKVLLVDGEVDQALRLSDLVIPHLTTNMAGRKTQILALKALALYCKGEQTLALEAFEAAIREAEAEKNLYPFIIPYLPMKDLVELAYARGIAPAFLTQILAHTREREMRQRPGTVSPRSDHQKEGSFGNRTLLEPLTDREEEILRQLNSPLPTPEIADTLAISVNTVRSHIKRIYAKLGAHSRSTVISRAKALELL